MLCFLDICLAIQMLARGALVPSAPGTVYQMENVPATALVAHLNLDGAQFYRIGFDTPIYVDGVEYAVTETVLLQALDPLNVDTDYVNVENGQPLGNLEAARFVFNRPGALVLITCYNRGEVAGWGRYFIIAERTGGWHGGR